MLSRNTFLTVGAGVLVLVVEDTAIIAMALASCLRDAGHTVLGPASRVTTALNLAAATRPDLALLDVRLLDGSGLDLAIELKARWGVPSFLLTGEPRAAGAGPNAAIGVLTKPYTKAEILGCITLAQRMLAGEPLTEVPHRLEFLAPFGGGGDGVIEPPSPDQDFLNPS